MYAVHQSKSKRVLVTGSCISIRFSRMLSEEDLIVKITEPNDSNSPIPRSHNLSRWPNKHRVEKMGKRRGRKCRK